MIVLRLDSAIYLVLRGARWVAMLEPYPDTFMEITKNTRLNNFENRIAPINAGLSSMRPTLGLLILVSSETQGLPHVMDLTSKS